MVRSLSYVYLLQLSLLILISGCKLDDSSIQGSIGGSVDLAPTPAIEATVPQPVALAIGQLPYSLTKAPSLNWNLETPGEGAVSINHFEVQIVKAEDDSVIKTFTPSSQALGLLDALLEDGKAYYFNVRSVADNGAKSEFVRSSNWTASDSGPAGTLDVTFSTTGVKAENFSSEFAAYSVSGAIDGKGRVVGVSSTGGANPDLYVWRNLKDGTLDSTFNSVGYRVFSNIAGGNGQDIGSGVTVDPMGRILITGYSENGSNRDMFVIRINDDGSLDTSFSGDGIFTHNNAGGGNGNDTGGGITVGRDGKIYVAGASYNVSVDYDAVVWKLNEDGTLDSTFAGAGYVSVGLSAHDILKGVKIDGSGKIVVIGDTGLSFDALLMRFNPDGSLDTTFDSDGYLTVNGTAGGFADNFHEIWFDNKGNIFVGGGGLNGSAKSRCAVWKFSRVNGAADASFGISGVSVLNVNPLGGTDHIYCNGFVPGPDGGVYISGAVYGPSSVSSAFVSRWDSTGSLDTTFGNSGYLYLDDLAGTSYNDHALALLVDGYGKLYSMGRSYSGSTGKVFAAKLHSGIQGLQGILDTSFSGDGMFTHHNAAGGNGDDYGYGVAFDWLGNIVSVGSSELSGVNSEWGIWRVDGLGALDTSFDANGVRVIGNMAGGNGGDRASGVVLDHLGKIVVIGTSQGSASSDMALVRFNSDGTLDTTFSGDGIFTHNSAAGGGTSDGAGDLLVDGHGKILVGGYSSNGTDMDIVLWRLNPNGTLDSSFDSDGIVVFDGGSGAEVIMDVKLDPNGKILVGGYTTIPTVGFTPCIWRFNDDGSIDTSFNSVGYKTFESFHDPSGLYRTINKILVDPEGQTLVTGQFIKDGLTTMFIFKLNDDGSLDTSFNSSGSVFYQETGKGYIGYGIAQDAVGNLWVSGAQDIGGNLELALWKFKKTGLLDTSYNGTGLFVNALGVSNAGYDMSLNDFNFLAITGIHWGGADRDMSIWKFK